MEGAFLHLSQPELVFLAFFEVLSGRALIISGRT